MALRWGKFFEFRLFSILGSCGELAFSPSYVVPSVSAWVVPFTLYLFFSLYDYQLLPHRILSQNESNFGSKIELNRKSEHNLPTTSLLDKFASRLPFVPFFFLRIYFKWKRIFSIGIWFQIFGQMRHDSGEWIWRKLFPSKTHLQINSETILQRYQVY